MYAVWDGKTGVMIGSGTPYWWWTTGVTLASRDFDGDGRADLLVKPTNALGSSYFGVWMAPSFVSYSLWRLESTVTGNGGPIG